MSIEQSLIQIIGIVLVLYFCIKTLILSTIRAYGEIYIDAQRFTQRIQERKQNKINQTIQEIKYKNLSDDIDYEVDRFIDSK